MFGKYRISSTPTMPAAPTSNGIASSSNYMYMLSSMLYHAETHTFNQTKTYRPRNGQKKHITNSCKETVHSSEEFKGKTRSNISRTLHSELDLVEPVYARNSCALELLITVRYIHILHGMNIFLISVQDCKRFRAHLLN